MLPGPQTTAATMMAGPIERRNAKRRSMSVEPYFGLPGILGPPPLS